jgi:hypothetical protein
MRVVERRHALSAFSRLPLALLATTLSVALAVDSATANVVRIDLQRVDLKAQLAQTAWITGAERIFCN